ncbi:MAG TPA: GAF domain-containing protein, partial [Roseiflexaceae bacterium]
MQDQRKTKAQLIVELAALRARVCELEQDQRTLHPAQHTPGSVVTNGEPAQRQPADRILRNLDLDEGVLFRSSPLPMWIFDRATRRLLAANDAVIQHYGYSRDEILRMSIEDIWLLEEIPALLRQIRSPNPQLGTISGTWKHRKKDGTIIDVDVVAQAIAYDGRPAQLAVINDVTEQRRVEHMLAGQQRFFEHLASGAPLDQTLAALVQRVEAQISGGLCTVLLLDESGRHLRHAASSALPRAYIEAIDGMEIGPQAGSCGAAAYLGETVIVADIASDPLWANYRDLALAHNLRACWSAPICDSQRRVLGAFTLYYRTPHEPSAAELAQVQGAAFLASVAIERRRVEEALRTSEMRYRLVSRATNDVIWDWDIVANKTEWNEYARTLFGSDSGQAM